MVLFDTPWNLETLGTSVELRFDGSEKLPEINPEIWSRHRYVAASLPMGNLELIHSLEDQGFRFVETKFSLDLDLIASPEIPEEVKLLARRSRLERINSINAFELLLQQIQAGIFQTDRIALDPKFGIQTSAARYINWLRNSYGLESSPIDSILYREKSVGFIFTEAENNHLQIKLGGIFTSYDGRGYGALLIYHPIQMAKIKGLNRVKTEISSNNVGIWRLYQAFGFKIVEARYLLRRTNNA